MAGRTLAYTVVVRDEHDVEHVFVRGSSDVPGWAEKLITNPSAWAESDTDDDQDEGGGSDADQLEKKSYSGMRKAELEAEVASRNEGRGEDDLVEVEGNGTIPDLIAALEADDAAHAGD